MNPPHQAATARPGRSNAQAGLPKLYLTERHTVSTTQFTIEELNDTLTVIRDQVDTVLHALREHGETLEFGRNGLIFLLDTASSTLFEVEEWLTERNKSPAA